MEKKEFIKKMIGEILSNEIAVYHELEEIADMLGPDELMDPVRYRNKKNFIKFKNWTDEHKMAILKLAKITGNVLSEHPKIESLFTNVDDSSELWPEDTKFIQTLILELGSDLDMSFGEPFTQHNLYREYVMELLKILNEIL